MGTQLFLSDEILVILKFSHSIHYSSVHVAGVKTFDQIGKFLLIMMTKFYCTYIFLGLMVVIVHNTGINV